MVTKINARLQRKSNGFLLEIVIPSQVEGPLTFPVPKLHLGTLLPSAGPCPPHVADGKFVAVAFDRR
jgi:hypothetical protein